MPMRSCTTRLVVRNSSLLHGSLYLQRKAGNALRVIDAALRQSACDHVGIADGFDFLQTVFLRVRRIA